MRAVVATVLIVTAALTAPARSDPDPADRRVVIADPDRELQHAVASTLEPWHIAVVAALDQPADAAGARRQAREASARFVVWRERTRLFVYDDQSTELDVRAVDAGTLDPVAAAGVALTIKTMMRLPPPPPDAPADAPPPPTPGPATAAPDEHRELRVQAAIGVRDASGVGADARVVVDAKVRPWARHGWRFGIGAEAGPGATIDRAGFKGTWTDWELVAETSWSYAARRWALEPWVALGLERSSLDGSDGMTAQSEHATLLAARAGATAWGRLGRWSAGVTVAFDTTSSPPTYTKPGAAAVVLDVPAFALVVAFAVATDLAW
jgi:hypothetical protein